MPEGTSNAIVSFGGLAKPVDTLIKKISNAVGEIYAPYQVKRMAEAYAEAAITKAEGEIKVTDLTRRAMNRFVEEETRHQSNIEAITDKALPLLKEGSDPGKMEDDWITNFFDKSRIVSDKEMQELWSHVLAGEANAPGTYSKRTVNALGDLDKRDAVLFQSLMGFCWSVGVLTPLVFNYKDSIYTENGVTFSRLTHLDSIGLIYFERISSLGRLGVQKYYPVSYCGITLLLTFDNVSENELPTGSVMLTAVGQELATVCKKTAVSGFVDYVRDKWKAYKPTEVIS